MPLDFIVHDSETSGDERGDDRTSTAHNMKRVSQLNAVHAICLFPSNVTYTSQNPPVQQN